MHPQASTPRQQRAGAFSSLIAAVQFLTRIPTPAILYAEDTLPRALVFFPIIGLGLGATAGFINRFLSFHLTRSLAALITTSLLVAITGALHEDGLADCADAFGSRHPVERTLAILRDSRIGSFGAIALTLSLSARVLLLATVPLDHALSVLIAAHTLSRWSAIPLTLLPSARPDSGQGVLIAQRTPRPVLMLGTLLTLIIVCTALRQGAVVPLLVSAAVVLVSALFYRRRIGGITGDCFGATNQLVEISVLTCGAWIA